jgi:hypothetical protein
MKNAQDCSLPLHDINHLLISSLLSAGERRWSMTDDDARRVDQGHASSTRLVHSRNTEWKRDRQSLEYPTKKYIDAPLHYSSFKYIITYYWTPPFVVWKWEETIVVDEHTTLQGDDEGYRNKRLNLPGPSWTTVCPWSQVGHSVQVAGCDSDSESESLTTLPFLAISDPSSVAILSPLGSHVGTSMGPMFSTTHPGCSTIQDTTKCGNVETQNQQWRNTRNGRAQLFDHSRALLEVAGERLWTSVACGTTALCRVQ